MAYAKQMQGKCMKCSTVSTANASDARKEKNVKKVATSRMGWDGAKICVTTLGCILGVIPGVICCCIYCCCDPDDEPDHSNNAETPMSAPVARVMVERETSTGQCTANSATATDSDIATDAEPSTVGEFIDTAAWVTDRVSQFKFESDEQREEMELFLRDKIRFPKTVAQGIIKAVEGVVIAAQVATLTLNVALAVLMRHEEASNNDRRVIKLCRRLRELHESVKQTRDFLAREANRVLDGESLSDTAIALQAPLTRVLEATQACREAINAWREVSRNSGQSLWTGFKRWLGRTAKSQHHADDLCAANDELREAYQQLGAAAALRSALNTTGSDWEDGNDDFKEWIRAKAEQDAEFQDEMRRETGEIKQLVLQLLPELERMFSHVDDRFDQLDEKLDQIIRAKGV
jgi:hypothetical protein